MTNKGFETWLIACAKALVDAEYLASRLRRMPGREGAELVALRLRISALRAEVEAMIRPAKAVAQDIEADPNQAELRSPWCPPPARHHQQD